MPCSSNNDPEIDHELVSDFTKQHPYTPTGIIKPKERRELVRAVTLVEAAGKRVKAQGANMSLSPAQVSDDYVIETFGLQRHLSRPFPAPPDGPLATHRFRDGHDKNHLAALVRPGVVLGDGKHLVHVEAGMRIKDLLADLATLGLALPTMGSRGLQTLAGALSTATHGSDVDRPPLTDFVRAVHLVGPSGQEWWIEPSHGVVRAPDAETDATWCHDVKVVRDDEFFRAALVTVGRFGVIYSMVLEVERQYWLYDRNDKHDWSTVRAQLGACAQSSSYDVEGVFLWNGERARYYSVVFDLARAKTCWVGRRRVTTNHDELGLGPAGGSESILCERPREGIGAGVFFSKAFFTALEIKALAIPFAGLVWAPRIMAFWAELVGLTHNSDTNADFLFRAFEKAAELPESEVGPDAYAEIRGLIRGLAEKSLAGEITPERRGPSGRIMDTHNYKAAHCIGGSSSEFFFNASQPQYLQFVDEVVEAASAHGPVAGFVSLRYMQGSHAHLAMQRWRISVAVEVAVARPNDGSGETLFKPFLKELYKLAKKWDAIPHWGQLHEPDADEIEARYKSSLGAWRWALAELQAHGGSTFSSQFSRDRGLSQGLTLDEHRAKRSAGVLAAALVPLLY